MLVFYFLIIIDAQRIAKIVQERSQIPCIQILPMASFIIIVQYQNQEIDTGTMFMCSLMPFYQL